MAGQITRRALVAGSMALGILPACKGDKAAEDTGSPEPEPAPDRDPEPVPWEPPGELDAEAFAWGVVVGDATESTAIVSVRTTETEALSLTLVVADGEGWTELSTTDSLLPVAGVLQHTLDGLSPDTAYSLVFGTSDGARRSQTVRFRTAPSPEAPLRKIVFGATSCFGGNWPFPSVGYAADEALDFFLLLGDTVYADGAAVLEDYQAFWETAFTAPPLQALFGSTSVVATWDDHEVDNNWSWDEVSQEKFDAALVAFREALPQGIGPGGTGIWRKIAWGPGADLFVLDSRGERKDGLYLSEAQMAWFQAELLASTARFKIILNSVPITDMTDWYGNAFEQDRWQGYAQRAEILNFIADNGITGVLWVSGDHHLGMINHVDAPGGVAADQWEVLTGPTGSRINVLGELVPLGEQYQAVILAWNWTRFTLDPNLGTALVQFVGDDGALLAEQVLTLS